jgi:hypothetical protein
VLFISHYTFPHISITKSLWSDATLKIYNAQTGSCPQISSLAVSGPGGSTGSSLEVLSGFRGSNNLVNRLAVGRSQGEILVINVENLSSPAIVSTITAHYTYTIKYLAACKFVGCKYLVSVGSDKTMKAWDLTTLIQQGGSLTEPKGFQGVYILSDDVTVAYISAAANGIGGGGLSGQKLRLIPITGLTAGATPSFSGSVSVFYSYPSRCIF